jgi:hypothetical protein
VVFVDIDEKNEIESTKKTITKQKPNIHKREETGYFSYMDIEQTDNA